MSRAPVRSDNQISVKNVPSQGGGSIKEQLWFISQGQKKRILLSLAKGKAFWALMRKITFSSPHLQVPLGILLARVPRPTLYNLNTSVMINTIIRINKTVQDLEPLRSPASVFTLADYGCRIF